MTWWLTYAHIGVVVQAANDRFVVWGGGGAAQAEVGEGSNPTESTYAPPVVRTLGGGQNLCGPPPQTPPPRGSGVRWDALLAGLSVAAGTDAHRDDTTWGGLAMMWGAVLEAVLAGGRDVFLCGPARPGHIAFVGLEGIPVRCAHLDIPDDVLSARLQARGEFTEDIEAELADAASLRASS